MSLLHPQWLFKNVKCFIQLQNWSIIIRSPSDENVQNKSGIGHTDATNNQMMSWYVIGDEIMVNVTMEGNWMKP